MTKFSGSIILFEYSQWKFKVKQQNTATIAADKNYIYQHTHFENQKAILLYFTIICVW